MTLRTWIARLNGTEIAFIPGLYLGMIGYMRDSETDAIAIGLVLGRVLIRWPPAPPTPPTVAPPAAQRCPVCGEAIHDGEPSSPLPAPPVFFRGPEPRVHEECYVFMRHGRVGCQRGECPNCDPPRGQSIREQARDANAFYKASKGRPSKREAAS